MNNITFKTIVIYCVILVTRSTLQNENLTCSTTLSKRYKILWPITTNWTLSSPPCVDKNKEFLTRKCINGMWDTEPECDYIQEMNTPKCPEGFIDSNKPSMCYVITTENCPFDDILPFETYRSILDNNGPFWMPVERDLSNGFGFSQWTELSELYKADFEGSYRIKGNIKDKNCLLYYNSSYIEAAPCNERHLRFCGYKKLDELTDQVCDLEGLCSQSDFFTNSKCFCASTNFRKQAVYPEVEFLKPYQNSVFRKLTNKTCSIALKKGTGGTFIWSNSKVGINYTRWSTDVIFDKTHIYGAVTNKGWILTEKPTSCFLFEKRIEDIKPTLELTFDDSNKKFILTVNNFERLKTINSKILLFCFTNADAFSLLFRYSSFNLIEKDQNITKYSFEPLEHGPGDYWCESIKFIDLEVIRSNSIFLRSERSFQYEFVAILQIKFRKLTRKDFLKIVSSKVFKKLNSYNHLRNFYNFRIMKIIDVDEIKKEALINVHLTSKILVSDHDIEYQIVKTAIAKVFSSSEDLQVKMLNFSSTSFCMSETKDVYWPKTLLGFKNTSTESCFKADDSLLSRLCQGDFIKGASWSAMTETCLDKYELYLSVCDCPLSSLSMITGFSSLLGLSFILFTAIVFKKWRQNCGNKILLNFSLCLFLEIIFFCVVYHVKYDPYNNNNKNNLFCTISGALLHYIFLSESCWMLVIAFLQYRRFVLVLGAPPQHILFKCCCIGWGGPIFPVIAVSIFGNYVYGSWFSACYPSGLSSVLGLWLPMGTVTFINLILFILIMYSVSRNRTECVGTCNRDVIFQWRLAILLFFVLGLTWTFGILINFSRIFLYLFYLTTNLQGFIVFLFYIVFNKDCRNMYKKALKKWCCRKN